MTCEQTSFVSLASAAICTKNCKAIAGAKAVHPRIIFSLLPQNMTQEKNKISLPALVDVELR